MPWALNLPDGSFVEDAVSDLYWYNTGGQDYSNSLALGYDVCAILFGGVRNNTHLRAQYDDGSCLAALDANCINALQQQAEALAMQSVGMITPLSNDNLTADSLPAVCASVGAGMNASLPPVCEPYFNNTYYGTVGYGLTTNYNCTGLFFGTPGSNCSITPSAFSNQTFNIVGGSTKPKSTALHMQSTTSLEASWSTPS